MAGRNKSPACKSPGTYYHRGMQSEEINTEVVQICVDWQDQPLVCCAAGCILILPPKYAAAPFVAQNCSLSVSVEIVAIRDDFSERGSATRSTLESQHRSNWLAAFLVSGCCGSQTRAPLVAASPRCDVSRICNPLSASMRGPADCESAWTVHPFPGERA